MRATDQSGLPHVESAISSAFVSTNEANNEKSDKTELNYKPKGNLEPPVDSRKSHRDGQTFARVSGRRRIKEKRKKKKKKKETKVNMRPAYRMGPSRRKKPFIDYLVFTTKTLYFFCFVDLSAELSTHRG
jgi:hypothetical protein